MLNAMVGWRNLGKYVKGLYEAGKLVRVTIPINKDAEFHPLERLQFRGLPESERNVYASNGRTYDTPVLVGAMAGRSEVAALDIDHIQRDTPGIAVTLIRSKTNQDGKHEEVLIPFARDAYFAQSRRSTPGSTLPESSTARYFEQSIVTVISGRAFNQASLRPSSSMQQREQISIPNYSQLTPCDGAGSRPLRVKAAPNKPA